LMRDLKATVVTAIATYPLRLVEVAREEQFDLASLSLRVGIFGSETWSDELRLRIERELAIQSFDIIGMTETGGPGMGIDCGARAGIHGWEDHYHPETVEPATGAVLPAGADGELGAPAPERGGRPRGGPPADPRRGRGRLRSLRGRADSPRALRPPGALPGGPLREARRARAISGQGGPGRGPPHRPVTRALEGVTVLSLEQATVLPFLTYRLACDGARVIRVENAGRPDPNRFVGRDVLGEADMRSYFLPNNCGKEAVTLNLGEAEGRRILRELVRALRVDVFATNQRPRSYAKLGIDDATLRAVKPDLIWLGVTGFGPDHDEAAYDPILQARAGFMELTGAPDGPPMVFGLPMVDLGAAEHGYGAIMRALYHRAVTGTGARLDVSMLRSAVSWMVSPVLLSASL